MTKTKVQLARNLIAAVEGGSIAEGARALNITRSAASKNISALENSLGVKLLNRSSRKISLTKAGEKYVRGVKSALSEIEAIESDISKYSKEPSGVLTIDSSILFGRFFLGNLIQDYLNALPAMAIDVRLNDGTSEVSAGVVDIYFRTGEVKHQDMIAIKLMDIKFRTVASSAYLERFGVPGSVDELTTHNCLNFRFPSDHSIFQWRFKLGEEIIRRKFRGNFTSTDAEEIRKATLGSLGVAQLPNQLVDRDVLCGNFVELFPETAFASKSLYMCFHTSRRNDVRVSSFKSLLKRQLN